MAHVHISHKELLVLPAAKKKSWHLSDNTILFDFTCVKVLLPLFHLVKEWVYFWKSCQKVEDGKNFARRGKAVKKRAAFFQFSICSHLIAFTYLLLRNSSEKCYFVEEREKMQYVNQQELINSCYIQKYLGK